MTLQEAIAQQRALAASVIREGDPADVRLIAGVDVSMNRFDVVGHAAVVLLTWPELRIVEVATASLPLPMAYVPGLLSFRELPIVMAAWKKLDRRPDLVCVDGQGIAHPRRLGIAAHLGVTLDLPAIGCGKSILSGRHAEVGPERGDREPLVHRGEVVGMALRTKPRSNPMIISVGHRIGLDAAVRWVLDLGRGYRLPEPTRQAHEAANAARRAAG